jgi:hypothetical protein
MVGLLYGSLFFMVELLYGLPLITFTNGSIVTQNFQQTIQQLSNQTIKPPNHKAIRQIWKMRKNI